MATQTLNLHLAVDAPRVVECAAALHQRLEPSQWQTLCALAAEILALREAATGSLVLVVSADRQREEVAKALGAPGLVAQMDQLRG